MTVPLVTYGKPDVAKMLGVSTRKLERLLQATPVGRMVGARLRFTERDIRKLWESQPCHSSSTTPSPVVENPGSEG